MRFLIAHGADIHAENNDGNTPLHVAAERSCLFRTDDHIDFLIKNGANINAKNNYGSTPLHNALMNFYELTPIANKNRMEFFIKNGADVWAKSKNGWAPLHLASKRKDGTVVQLLIDAGADAAEKTNEGYTPLHFAAERGSSEVVQALINAGAKVNEKNKLGETPLFLMNEEDDERLKILKILIKNGAKVNMCASNSSPLREAIYSDDRKSVAFLIESGACVNDGCNSSKTVIEVAESNW